MGEGSSHAPRGGFRRPAASTLDSKTHQKRGSIVTQPTFEHLFSPTTYGKLQLKNRMVKTAAQTYLFDSGERRFGPLAEAFYGNVAKGGVGMIIVETPAMEMPLPDEGDRRLRVDDDKYRKDIEDLANVIHAGGIPALMQFYHRGPWGGIYRMLAKPVAASSVTYPSPFDVHEEEPPAALTIDEIQELTAHFADCAGRIAECGFEGVEINAAADHLFHSFLSRFWNRRDDEYGPQNWENRTRFIREVIEAMRDRCGPDFHIQILMNAIEVGAPDNLGISLDEGKYIAQMYEKCGVDSLHVRYHWVGMHQGSYLSDVLFYPEPHIPLSEFPKEMDWSHKGQRCNLPLAEAVHPVVNIPIMTVGGFDAATADQAIADGKTDLVGFNRRLFADAQYPEKMRSGRALQVQPCTKCGYCSSTYNVPRHCRINACFGTESYDLVPLGAKKKVLVIGGGPAGMQAARVAAWRGHDVALWDKSKYLGGSMSLAAMVKGASNEDVREVIWFLRREVNRFGVDVQLGKEIDAAAIEAALPDVVLIASGGKPQLPDVPGVMGKNVVRSADLYGTLQFYLRLVGPQTLRDLTKYWMPVGKNVVIIGGAIQGCQLGEFLTKRGRKVTIVDTEEELGRMMYPERKTRLFYWFDNKGVERLGGVKLLEITDKGLSLETKEGEKRFLEADSAVIALPFKGDHSLEDALQGRIPEVYSIGDCDEPGLIPDATAAGWKIGNAI
jgi:2,4-dienoyl-CoA reductase (NADPH2)